MNIDVSKMTDEEIRDELSRVRSERAGRGMQKRRQAKTKRIDGHYKQKKVEKVVKAVEDAEWC